MNDFTAEEIRIITEAVLAGPEVGSDRLTEVFGTGLRATRAAQLADQLRTEGSADLGDGTVLARDCEPTGAALHPVNVVRDAP